MSLIVDKDSQAGAVSKQCEVAEGEDNLPTVEVELEVRNSFSLEIIYSTFI